jgi:hypothetical protein
VHHSGISLNTIVKFSRQPCTMDVEIPYSCIIKFNWRKRHALLECTWMCSWSKSTYIFSHPSSMYCQALELWKPWNMGWKATAKILAVYWKSSSHVQNNSGTHSASCLMGIRNIYLIGKHWSIKLITHFSVVPRSVRQGGSYLCTMWLRHRCRKPTVPQCV